jgi:hypothetical protein
LEKPSQEKTLTALGEGYDTNCFGRQTAKHLHLLIRQ